MLLLIDRIFSINRETLFERNKLKLQRKTCESFFSFFPRLSELDIAQLDREITKKEKPIGKLFSLSCCRRGAIKFLILFSLKKKPRLLFVCIRMREMEIAFFYRFLSEIHVSARELTYPRRTFKLYRREREREGSTRGEEY